MSFVADAVGAKPTFGGGVVAVAVADDWQSFAPTMVMSLGATVDVASAETGGWAGLAAVSVGPTSATRQVPLMAGRSTFDGRARGQRLLPLEWPHDGRPSSSRAGDVGGMGETSALARRRPPGCSNVRRLVVAIAD